MFWIKLVTAANRELKQACQFQLNQTLKEEEVKWIQISKEREMFEGDRNTSYYHAKANGRRNINRREKCIFCPSTYREVYLSSPNLFLVRRLP